jgi:hypothetical protein
MPKLPLRSSRRCNNHRGEEGRLPGMSRIAEASGLACQSAVTSGRGQIVALCQALHKDGTRQRLPEGVGLPILVLDSDDPIQGAHLLNLEHPAGHQPTLP